MKAELSGAIKKLIEQAPSPWLEELCAELRSWPTGANGATLLHKLPPTHNGDLAFQSREVVKLCHGQVSWEALGTAISLLAAVCAKCQTEQQIELLWAGPPPPTGMPARRIDQALYDLISCAEREILLITFAAHKIQRLADNLAVASRRGVGVRLLLEFESQSQHQLSRDALKAFPADLRTRADVYYWPLEKRELNLSGRPGKLHAKAAVVDNQALLSSANLTDDAFLRNLELGALFTGGDLPVRLREHFEHLVGNGTLVRWS